MSNEVNSIIYSKDIGSDVRAHADGTRVVLVARDKNRTHCIMLTESMFGELENYLKSNDMWTSRDKRAAQR